MYRYCTSTWIFNDNKYSKNWLRESFYLHDAIPVVARGDLKQGQEGHAKVFKGSMTTHTFTWIVFIAN